MSGINVLVSDIPPNPFLPLRLLAVCQDVSTTSTSIPGAPSGDGTANVEAAYETPVCVMQQVLTIRWRCSSATEKCRCFLLRSACNSTSISMPYTLKLSEHFSQQVDSSQEPSLSLIWITMDLLPLVMIMKQRLKRYDINILMYTTHTISAFGMR